MKNFPHLVIIADDLTGSGDAGLFFARSAPVPVIFYNELPRTKKIPAKVLVIDTESRQILPETAFHRQQLVLKFLRNHLKANYWIYKKIDSTLRGNIIPETKAILKERHLPENKIPVIVAFPKQKRYTINNWQYVGNRRLDKTQFVRDPRNKIITANVRELFEKISPERFEIYNCQNQKQLKKIAKNLFKHLLKYQIIIGAAGVLEEIARIYLPAPVYPFIIPEYKIFSKNILVINGSANPASHKQVNYLRQHYYLARNQSLTIISPPQKRISPESIQKSIIKNSKKIITQEQINTIIICGGETSFNLIKSLHLRNLKIVGAIEPGIAIISCGKFNFILKPGGFGKKDILKKIVRFISRSGGQQNV